MVHIYICEKKYICATSACRANIVFEHKDERQRGSYCSGVCHQKWSTEFTLSISSIDSINVITVGKEKHPVCLSEGLQRIACLHPSPLLLFG